MAPILNNQHSYLNGGNVNGINGGPTFVSNNKPYGMTSGNTAYGASGSAA